MGLPPDRPDYQTLEREGVPLVESGNAAGDQATMQLAQIDKLRAQILSLEQETLAFRTVYYCSRPGDIWVDPRGRRWKLIEP
jgi:hypothetical protein